MNNLTKNVSFHASFSPCSIRVLGQHGVLEDIILVFDFSNYKLKVNFLGILLKGRL